MELSTWLVYISVISILIFSPGPSALLCISDGVKFGNKKTIPTILGGAIAALLLMTISAVGLGAILAASGTLFFIIKLLGAGYLIFLGWSAWKDDGHEKKLGNNHDSNTIITSPLYAYSSIALFKKGFMVGISNPKDLLFFIALFPSFINAELPPIEQYTILALTWFVIDCTSMFIYAGIGAKAGPLLANSNIMKIVNRSVGSLFIVLGSILAISTGLKEK